MQVNIKSYPVEILTGHYQISGSMDVRGNPAVFINDASYSSFNIQNATLVPLMVGASAGAITRPVVYLPKNEPQVMLIGDFSAQDAQLLSNKIRLVCFTDTYIIRAEFRGGSEMTALDVFSSGGPLFAATEADIVPLRPLASDLGGQADLVYVHKSAVRAYYPD